MPWQSLGVKDSPGKAFVVIDDFTLSHTGYDLRQSTCAQRARVKATGYGFITNCRIHIGDYV